MEGTQSMARKFSIVSLTVTVALAATVATTSAVGAVGTEGAHKAPGLSVDAKSQQLNNHWVNTWTSMPQLTEPSNMPPAPFTQDNLVLADSTLRQTVHMAVGGRQMRLRFSNAFGGAALPITAVSVALPAAWAGLSTVRSSRGPPGR